MKRLISLSLLLFSLGWLLGSNTWAITMESDSYRLETNMTNIRQTTQPTKPGVSQVGMPEPSVAKDGQVSVGFAYLQSEPPFSLSLSDNLFDLSQLKTFAFNDFSHSLTVSPNSAGGYQVVVLANKQVSSSSSNLKIDKTVCGSPACGLSQAQTWVSLNYPGLGFNAKGDDVLADFQGPDYFRPLPDQENNNRPTMIMTGVNTGHNRQATITYRLAPPNMPNISDYETTITITAIPRF